MRALWVLVILCWPLTAKAQITASLVADSVTVVGETQLIATGNVQAFYAGATLSASRIIYDRPTDRLIIEGPIFLREENGDILLADRAELDPRFENGLLRGARLVLNQQLQLAANQISRVEDGRYSALTRTVATSCQVCGTRAPLWEIRAETVIHDTEARQLYFEDASLHVRGVPIFWLPRMRLPDPTLDRATGFLTPSIPTTNDLGVGIKIPYFIRLGDRADLTLTPYYSGATNTLEARFRQAYLAGDIEINAAVSRDDLLPDTWRSYIEGNGRFDLGRDFKLTFSTEAVSDPDYLSDYSYSEADRLASGLRVVRVDDDELFVAEGNYYASLRDGEVDSSLPPLVLSFGYERRIVPDVIGGVVTWGVSGDALNRDYELDPDNARDLSRLGLMAAYHNQWIAPIGIVATVDADLRLDYYAVADDPAAESGWRVGPAAAITLRWPFVRPSSGGVTQVIEPVVSLGYSDSIGVLPPNEDALLAELDEGNLYALTRTPGQDAREVGTRVSAGVAWTRTGPGGEVASLSFGRVYQSETQPAYSLASGQSSATSDWLLTAGLETRGGFGIDLRTLFDDHWSFNKTETRIDWENDRIGLAAAYLWLPADPSRDRETPASEWRFDATAQLSPNWAVSADARYDVGADQLARAGLGVGWQNECVTVDLSAERRYSSSTDEDPTTTYNLTINLIGFSTGRSTAGPTGQCRD
ncbi:LPS-assembly protein LptD [Flavimaricola marinus]|uniref:LPS-assembly protein LptD n=1 Tax=Flavimaricola marinus TaxID=1819565 RepID=A0A238LJ20_9RHOB|nr:LPS assembly protein LptD [Flavimaricola marinus]SMY09618.1 LPS-assembly protein LptD precursor [Flavimaricola marinus]